jgi:hypothetical protein
LINHQQDVARPDNKHIGLVPTYLQTFSTLNLSEMFSGCIDIIPSPIHPRRQCCDPWIWTFRPKSHISKSINLSAPCRLSAQRWSMQRPAIHPTEHDHVLYLKKYYILWPVTTNWYLLLVMMSKQKLCGADVYGPSAKIYLGSIDLLWGSLLRLQSSIHSIGTWQ